MRKWRRHAPRARPLAQLSQVKANLVVKSSPSSVAYDSKADFPRSAWASKASLLVGKQVGLQPAQLAQAEDPRAGGAGFEEGLHLVDLVLHVGHGGGNAVVVGGGSWKAWKRYRS